MKILIELLYCSERALVYQHQIDALEYAIFLIQKEIDGEVE